MSSTVKEMLEFKKNEIWTCAPDQTVIDAVAEMADHRVGALTVLDGDKLVGIVSERDYARKMILEGRDAKQTNVSEIMTPDPITVSLDESVDKCMATMATNRIRHLPVIEGDKLIGIIAVDDVLKAVIRDQEKDLEALEELIRADEGGSG